MASFLLGLPSTASRIVGQDDLDLAQYLHHIYIQDDFKVNSKLTLNLGLRWEYDQWPHHRRGRLSGFDTHHRPIVLGFRKSRYGAAAECAAADRGSALQELRSTFWLRLPSDAEDDSALLLRYFLQLEFFVGMERLTRRLAIFVL